MFNKVREKLQLNGNGDIRPRLYDLRHSFATHRLYQWMKNGEDLNTKLPYLSIYMGHKSLTETFHYIHLVPGMFETMSGFQYRSATDIFPEVVTIDE
jgi:integrase